MDNTQKQKYILSITTATARRADPSSPSSSHSIKLKVHQMFLHQRRSTSSEFRFSFGTAEDLEHWTTIVNNCTPKEMYVNNNDIGLSMQDCGSRSLAFSTTSEHTEQVLAKDVEDEIEKQRQQQEQEQAFQIQCQLDALIENESFCRHVIEDNALNNSFPMLKTIESEARISVMKTAERFETETAAKEQQLQQYYHETTNQVLEAAALQHEVEVLLTTIDRHTAEAMREVIKQQNNSGGRDTTTMTSMIHDIEKDEKTQHRHQQTINLLEEQTQYLSVQVDDFENRLNKFSTISTAGVVTPIIGKQPIDALFSETPQKGTHQIEFKSAAHYHRPFSPLA
eukprot:PhM_4_TR4244/c0_g1_i1/m.64024